MTCVPLDDATISYKHLMVLYLWMSISKIKTLKTSSRKKQKKTSRSSPFVGAEETSPSWSVPTSTTISSISKQRMVLDFVEDMDFMDFEGCIWNHIWHHFVKWWMKWWSNLGRLVTAGAVRGAGARALAWCGPGHLLPLAHKIEVKHWIITDVLQRYCKHIYILYTNWCHMPRAGTHAISAAKFCKHL